MIKQVFKAKLPFWCQFMLGIFLGIGLILIATVAFIAIARLG